MAGTFIRRIAAVLALALFLTGFAYAAPVSAASKADMAKANVKWDLKNNKTIKYKTAWTEIGARQHTVKMTDLKIRNAKKKGYKQCTFTLTYKRDINPTQKQKDKMAWLACTGGEFVMPGGNMWFAAVDYNTGKGLAKGNKQKVSVSWSKWKYSDYEKIAAWDGIYFRYARKATVKVKIIYPKKYKRLAVGVGGFTEAPHIQKTVYSSSPAPGIGVASATGGIVIPDADKFFAGKKKFSTETLLYSKKDKSYAHFMRIN